MKQSADPSRRDFLFNLVATGGVLVSGGLVLSACGKSEKKAPAAPAKKEEPKKAELSCTDTTGLKPADIKLRETNEYVDKSPKAGQNCENCNLYTAAPAAGKCGGCKVVQGPIHPKGWCKLWMKKA